MSNKNYELLMDNDLLKLYKTNDDCAEMTIIERYKNLVKIKSRTYFLVGGENEDLIQEGMIGLIKAMKDFDITKGASFNTFADLCISRQMITAIRRANSKKYQPLNSSYSLNTFLLNEKNEEIEYIDLLESKDKSPEEVLISYENTENIYKLIESELSKLEKEVIHRYLKGNSYQEIAMNLDKTEKAVDNALQRVRNKLQKKISN